MSVARTNPLPDPLLTQQEDGQVAPYAPSFIDRFTDFIQRLPIPYALTYLLLFLLQSAAILAVSWIDGSLTLSRFDPIVLLFPLWLWGPLAIVTYLDSLSLRTLSEFGPLLDTPPETKGRLEYEFTTMPTRGVLISALGWSCVYLLFWVVAIAPNVAAYDNRALATWFWFLVGFVSFAVGSVIYYHTLRQLRLVSRTVRMVRQFDLFVLDPVYAFSVLTARTGMAWVALITLTLLISPLSVGGIAEWSTLILQIALAMAAFFLPLRIVNMRLVSEKRGQLAELDQRVKATLAGMNKAIDDNSLEQVSRFNDALKALTSQREILARIPTWPWRPGLFAGFVSIIVLPVVLFLLQFALGRWLGP